MTHPISHLSSPGQKYREFRLLKITEISELQCVLRELVHEPSGAQVMHIENEDPENLFCLSFQTLPENSRGAAHILEHTVLCGSKKFPVKDPFFAMNRRSLNTFMNALTGADFTCYPAATQVKKDFYNLLEVYLDAVFHPILNILSFLQEGHRIEFSNRADPEAPLEYKGIVYNEMKGALSSAGARLSEAMNAALFPDITYGINSGGDPKDIPKLSYTELKQFYSEFYHPSRCLFFFYGNMPLEGHLDFISEHALQGVKPSSPLPPIPLQKRFTRPVYQELTYPIAADEDPKEKTWISFGFLTCNILKQTDALALSILEIILMDTDASPLKKALLQSGLCKQVSSFIDVEINEIPWGVTLKGCKPEDADAIENILKTTLQDICTSGIPTQMVENAIHQLEFYRSEITGDHAPFGLSLFMRSALLKQHGVDPEGGLKIHSLFDSLHKGAIQDVNYFTRLIEVYLLHNPHFVRIVMRPDPNLGEKEARKEKEQLELIKQSLSKEQVEAVVQSAATLAAFQKKQEEEDIDVLPKVSLSDIPPLSKDYPLMKERVGNLEVFHHRVFTNEIVYADLVFPLPSLAEEDLSYLRLLTVVLHQIGCGGRSYLENLEYIQGNTGGVGLGIDLNLHADNYKEFTPTLHVRGKALHRKAGKLFSLLHEMVTTATFDDIKRIKEILVKHFTGLESRLSGSALKYAINLSASSLNVASKVANDLYGLEYYWKVRDIVKRFDEIGPQVITKLENIYAKVCCLENPHLIIGSDAKMYDQLRDNGFYGLKDMICKPLSPWRGDHIPLGVTRPQGRIIASPVAFIGKVFSTVSYVHPDAPALSIAACLFDNLTLHAKIREQGGAYGGGAVGNALSGNFYFYSYRDPNIVETCRAFEESVHNLLKGDFDDADLEEAKFEMIQGLDAPVAPGSRAETSYSWLLEKRDRNMRQAYRDRLLSLDRTQIIRAVEQHIVPQMDHGVPVVFAGKELLEKANDILKKENKEPLSIEGI